MDIKFAVKKLINNKSDVSDWIDLITHLKRLHTDRDLLLHIHTVALKHLPKEPSVGYKKLMVGLANLQSETSSEDACSTFLEAKCVDPDCAVVRVYYAQFEYLQQNLSKAREILQNAKQSKCVPKKIIKKAHVNLSEGKLSLLDGILDPWNMKAPKRVDKQESFGFAPMGQKSSEGLTSLRRGSNMKSGVTLFPPTRVCNKVLASKIPEPKLFLQKGNHMFNMHKGAEILGTPAKAGALCQERRGPSMSPFMRVKYSPIVKRDINLASLEENVFSSMEKKPPFKDRNRSGSLSGLFGESESSESDCSKMFTNFFSTKPLRKSLSSPCINEKVSAVTEIEKETVLVTDDEKTLIEDPVPVAVEPSKSKCSDVISCSKDNIISLREEKPLQCELVQDIQQNKLGTYTLTQDNSRPVVPNSLTQDNNKPVVPNSLTQDKYKPVVPKTLVHDTSKPVVPNSLTQDNNKPVVPKTLVHDSSKPVWTSLTHRTVNQLGIASDAQLACQINNLSMFQTKESVSNNEPLIANDELAKRVNQKFGENKENVKPSQCSIPTEIPSLLDPAPAYNQVKKKEEISNILPSQVLKPPFTNQASRIKPEPRKLLDNPTVKSIPSVPSTNFLTIKLPTELNNDLAAKAVATVNGKTYYQMSVLGRGGSSKVYEVMSEDGSLYALKKVRLDNVDDTILDMYKNEITWLSKLQNEPDHIIRLFGWEMTKNSMLMVLEKGGKDFSQILKSKTLAEDEMKLYWAQMLRAVEVIHKAGVVHTDLKPSNFLLVGSRLKLIDFGIANGIQDNKTSVTRNYQMGTLNYMSPEALVQDHCRISRASDVWSLGCILYYMVYKRTPYSDIKNHYARFHALQQGKTITYEDGLDPHLLECLKNCLIHDRKERYTIQQLLTHPYLIN